MKIYHTETRADYHALLVELEEQGYSWMYGGKPTEWHDAFWGFYKENTCVRVNSDKQIQFCGIDYYKEEYPNMTILNFKEKQEYHTTTTYLSNRGEKQMKKEFYIGQPLIIKETGEQATFVYGYGEDNLPCKVVKKDGQYVDYYEYGHVEPSTKFKFSEIIAGLEQGYFEVGTEFRIPSTGSELTVKESDSGFCLERLSELLSLTPKDINSTWILDESRKEMTLEEIEAELGYKIKLKDNGGN